MPRIDERLRKRSRVFVAHSFIWCLSHFFVEGGQRGAKAERAQKCDLNLLSDGEEEEFEGKPRLELVLGMLAMISWVCEMALVSSSDETVKRKQMQTKKFMQDFIKRKLPLTQLQPRHRKRTPAVMEIPRTMAIARVDQRTPLPKLIIDIYGRNVFPHS